MDFLSSLLAIVAMIIGLGGVFAFMNFRKIAKTQAKEEAEKIAQVVAEKAANTYLQKELPGILAANKELFSDSSLGDDSADHMAEAQEQEK